jgi:hypothetical protein
MNISDLATTGSPSLSKMAVARVLSNGLIVALPSPLLILLISLYVPVILLSALGSLLIIFGVARLVLYTVNPPSQANKKTKTNSAHHLITKIQGFFTKNTHF